MRDAVTRSLGRIVRAGEMRGQQFGLTNTEPAQVRIGRVGRSRLRGLPEDVVDRLPVSNEVQTHGQSISRFERSQFAEVIEVWQIICANWCEIERARVQSGFERFGFGLVRLTFAASRDAFFYRVA